MKIEFSPNLGYNTLFYADNKKLKDEYIPIQLVLDQKKFCWEMSFCHELGHALSSKMDDFYNNEFKEELRAWRLAKSFCKPKYWNEQEAIKMLLTYRYNAPAWLSTDKLRIIPLNTNKWLIGKLKSKY